MDSKFNKIIILGAGKSGIAASHLAKKTGYSVKIYDDNIEEFIPNSNSLLFKDADCVVVSPGIPRTSPIFTKALKSGKPVLSELEFASRHISAPMIAVTGTNGKTTTVEFLSFLFNTYGIKSVTAGNIGIPLSQVAMNLISKPNETHSCLLVTEVSSFQLEQPDNKESFTFCPKNACIINISSDHEDRYPSYNEYVKTKFKIFKNIKNPADIILNENLIEDFKHYFPKYSAKEVTTFGFGDKKSLTLFCDEDKNIFFKGKYLVNLKNTLFEHPHNIENFMAAFAMFLRTAKPSLIFNNTELRKIVEKFKPSSHRQEIFLRRKGIIFVDDSKATNPAAMFAAVTRFGRKRNICIILGGADKNMDFSPLAQMEKYIKHASITGTAAGKIAKICEKHNISFSIHTSFDNAVNTAYNTAKRGDIVLLSPACASTDSFKDYKERGKRFKDLIFSY